MPKKDKTFTHRDVIRIFCTHLDEDERNKVIIFFYVIIPAFFTFDFVIDIILTVIGGRIGKLAEKILGTLGFVLSGMKTPIISLLIAEEDEQVYLDCIDNLDLD